MNIDDIWQVPEDGWNENPVDTLTAAIRQTPTEAGIKHIVEATKALREMAEAYFWARYKVDPEWRKHFISTPDIRSIEYGWCNGANTVEIECACRACNRGCCGTDYHTYEFPLSYLWLDQTAILADIAAKAEAKKRAEEEAQRKREAEAARKREEAEKQKLKELAAKYPAEVPVRR